MKSESGRGVVAVAAGFPHHARKYMDENMDGNEEDVEGGWLDDIAIGDVLAVSEKRTTLTTSARHMP